MMYFVKYPGTFYVTDSWDKLMARMVALPAGTPVKGGTLAMKED